MLKKLTTIMMICILVMISLTTTTYAASYNSVPRKYIGFGVSMQAYSNWTISTKLISQLENEKSYPITTTDEFTTSQSITFSSGVSKVLSSAISVETGIVSGQLGAEMQAQYNFAENYVRSYKKTITATVPANDTYTVRALIKGDKIVVYWKYFIYYQEYEHGVGSIYVPKYVSWVCS